MAILRLLLRAIVIPAYLVAAPFARLALSVIGWALVLAAFGSWSMAAEVGVSAWWRGALFALGAGLCHWLRLSLRLRPG